MKLNPSPKLDHGKADHPENTVAMLDRRFNALWKCEYFEVQVMDSLYWGGFTIEELKFACTGKGTSSLLCKASALGEAAERLAIRDSRRLKGYVNAHQDTLPSPLRIEELLGGLTLTADDLNRIKGENYGQHWVDGESLLADKTLQVPVEYTYDIGSTNGIAAGNTLAEAIVQATNEVWERHVAIRTLRNRLVVPTFDEGTIGNEMIQRQLAFIRSRNIDVVLKDLSFGGVFPCVGAYFVNHNLPPHVQGNRVLKVASSLDSEEALTRTLTEFAQGRRFDSASPPRLPPETLECYGDDTTDFRRFFRFYFIPYIESGFLAEGNHVRFESGRRYSDHREEIDHFMGMCRRFAADYVVVDLTDPVVRFPVAKVVIPRYSDILPYHPDPSRVAFEGWQG